MTKEKTNVDETAVDETKLLRALLDERDAALKESNEEVETLKARLDERDMEVADLNVVVDQRDQKIREQRSQLFSSTVQIAFAKAELQKAKSRIAELKEHRLLLGGGTILTYWLGSRRK